MNEEDEKSFKAASKCHICNKLNTEKDIRARDHYHIKGKYRIFFSSNLEC